MTRAPFIVIDGRLYRWKDILELVARNAPPPEPHRQANWRYLRPCTTTAARPPSARHSGVFCIGVSGLGECGARDIGAGASDGQAISACDPRRYIGDTGWFDEGERSARRDGIGGQEINSPRDLGVQPSPSDQSAPYVSWA
jgi:hypothetical protein